MCIRNPIISNGKTVRYYGIKHCKPDPLRELRPTHFETVSKDRDTHPVTRRTPLNLVKPPPAKETYKFPKRDLSEMYLEAGDCANFYILWCSMRAEFSYTYNSTQNITHKGGGRCANRAPTADMVAEGRCS